MHEGEGRMRYRAIPPPLNSRNSVSELGADRSESSLTTLPCMRVRVGCNSNQEFWNWVEISGIPFNSVIGLNSQNSGD
jgi:hypothetical protein